MRFVIDLMNGLCTSENEADHVYAEALWLVIRNNHSLCEALLSDLESDEQGWPCADIFTQVVEKVESEQKTSGQGFMQMMSSMSEPNPDRIESMRLLGFIREADITATTPQPASVTTRQRTEADSADQTATAAHYRQRMHKKTAGEKDHEEAAAAADTDAVPTIKPAGSHG